jgi:uncharacterized protein YjbI with pentapeptide repeats
VTEPKRDDETPVSFLEWLGLTDSPNFAKHRFIGGIASVALSLLLTLALFAAVVALVRSFTAAEAGLGTGGLIVALLGAPFLIWSTVLKHQTLRYQKEGHITDRINKAVEQLGAEKTVKRKGVETTVPNIEVRIGAILSLERIAQDSTKHDKGRDHVRVMEILCAYIRENAPASLAKDHDFGEWVPLKDDPTDEERAAHLAKRKERFGQHFIAGKVGQWAKTLPDPRADIAIALRVIGRRDAQQRLAEARWGKDARATNIWVFDIPCPALPDGDGPTSALELDNYRADLQGWKEKIFAYRGYRLDLRKTCLQHADLSDLCLSGAKLDDARLEGANLNEARLEGANLSEARLKGADLSEARLEGADLHKAWFEEASLVRARSAGADLNRARMEGANLYFARMEGAYLTQVRMEGAYLIAARMEGADLYQARMEATDLYQTRMEGTDLSEAQMEGAALTSTRLEGTDLSAARLKGAKFRKARMDAGTKLSSAVFSKSFVKLMDISDVIISLDQINSMFGDASVTLPNGVTPTHPDWPEHWPKQELERSEFLTAYNAWLSTQP